MKYFLTLMLAALPALGQPGVVAPVALFTDFQPPPPPAVLASMRREVATIMAPLGFPFQWWELGGGAEYQSAAELAVVTFRGECVASYPVNIGSGPGPLGFTYITDGQVLPFAEVDCGRIREFLRDELARIRPKDRDAVFGRAVGRVLAHELFHIFARTPHHGSRGVAEPAFTQQELLADGFRLETHEFRALRASLQQARQQNRRVRAAASPFAGRFIFEESGCAACHGAQGKGTASAPSLRAALTDARTFAVRLGGSFKKMSGQAKAARLSCQALDEDEIEDVLSFLGHPD
jgi:mono/diheme cytochrome c family protein